MAKRYSGQVTIDVVYRDSGDYKARVSGPGGSHTVYVGAPASGFGPGIAYDSPEAYDDTAHAALSFADDEEPGIAETASLDAEGSGWWIGRSKAAAWPKEPGVGEAREGYSRWEPSDRPIGSIHLDAGSRAARVRPVTDGWEWSIWIGEPGRRVMHNSGVLSTKSAAKKKAEKAL